MSQYQGTETQNACRWKADFFEAGKTALAAGKSGPSARQDQLEVEVADLTQALGKAAVERSGLEEERGGPAGPFEDLEVIRAEAGMSISANPGTAPSQLVQVRVGI